MVQIPERLLDEIIDHVRKGYPNEVCGLLVGRRDIEIKTVVEFHPVPNLNQARASDRYDLDPKAFERIDKDARAHGLEIIGIYHSHPDHPPRPSETDRASAWPVWSYLIFSVLKGKSVIAKSWVLNEATRQFEEEELDITDGEVGAA